jgi:hypothetical protein
MEMALFVSPSRLLVQDVQVHWQAMMDTVFAFVSEFIRSCKN